MTKKVFAVQDVVAKVYGSPMLFTHVGEATRDFGDAVKNPKTMISAHPEDYRLYCLGEFDDVKGIFTTHDPEMVCNAIDFVPPKLDK